MADKTIINGMITIKMTNKVFLKEFNPAFSAIANLPANAKSGKLKYAIKRTVGGVQKVGEAHSNKVKEICEPLSALDDNGNPKTSEDGLDYIFQDSDARKKSEKAIEKLNNEEINLTVYPIHLSTLTDAHKISVALEINLGEFITENTELNNQIAEDEKKEKKTN